jgi:hypothetical protein
MNGQEPIMNADALLTAFLRENGATAATVDGAFAVIDLSELGPTLGDYGQGLIESLRHVEVLTVANTTLRTLDLSGFGRLRELRLGAVRREIQINVSECAALRSFVLLPDAAASEQFETLVLCRLDQLSVQDARAMEDQRRTPGGQLTVRFEFVDGSEVSGTQSIRPTTGEMLGWLSRHPTTDLATILASHWHECPWFWAQYDAPNELPAHQRATLERLKDIEARVASGFYVSRAHEFDLRDHAWRNLERDRPPGAVLAREIPPRMFVAPFTAEPPLDAPSPSSSRPNKP